MSGGGGACVRGGRLFGGFCPGGFYPGGNWPRTIF